jgi:hypothetical protein
MQEHVSPCHLTSYKWLPLFIKGFMVEENTRTGLRGLLANLDTLVIKNMNSIPYFPLHVLIPATLVR